MRVALMGGSFDPIHRAHLAIARAAAGAFALDRVAFAPTARQPLKPEPAVASYVDRMTMVRLAIEAPGAVPPACEFVLSGLDGPRGDREPNYTVDVLTALATELPAAELWSIAGVDSFLTLRQWREPERLLELAQWIVVSRPGSPLSEEQIAALGLTEPQRARVHLLNTVHEDVSATELRQRLAQGDTCADYIPEPVAAYIAKTGLYRQTGQGNLVP